jgi:hypothetical protein
MESGSQGSRERLLGEVLGGLVVLAVACWLCVYPLVFVARSRLGPHR